MMPGRLKENQGVGQQSLLPSPFLSFVYLAKGWMEVHIFG